MLTPAMVVAALSSRASHPASHRASLTHRAIGARSQVPVGVGQPPRPRGVLQDALPDDRVEVDPRGLQQVQGQHRGLLVLAVADQLGVLGKARSYLLRAEFYRTLFSLARRGATKIVPVREVTTFADGETLDLPGRPRAVHAPGHSPAARRCCWRGAGCC